MLGVAEYDFICIINLELLRRLSLLEVRLSLHP